MKFNLNDTVAVINQNKIGVIVETFTTPKEGYLVEFCNDKGETVETSPFYPQDLKFGFSKITIKNLERVSA
jgi:hypothetical protein